MSTGLTVNLNTAFRLLGLVISDVNVTVPLKVKVPHAAVEAVDGSQATARFAVLPLERLTDTFSGKV